MYQVQGTMYLPKYDWFQNVRAESYCYHNPILGTLYFVLACLPQAGYNTLKIKWYKVRYTGLKISNAECRILIEE